MAPAPVDVLPPTASAPHPPQWGAWRRVPTPVRRLVVAVLGSGLVLLGCVLLVVPGPFTIPPVMAGLALLGSEFAWARRLRVQATARWQAARRAWPGGRSGATRAGGRS